MQQFWMVAKILAAWFKLVSNWRGAARKHLVNLTYMNGYDVYPTPARPGGPSDGDAPSQWV
jgi:hypothetical protein